MSKHYYHSLGAGDFHRPVQRNWGWGSMGLFTSLPLIGKGRDRQCV
ncbi:hypothetical protein [Nostoc sp.]